MIMQNAAIITGELNIINISWPPVIPCMTIVIIHRHLAGASTGMTINIIVTVIFTATVIVAIIVILAVFITIYISFAFIARNMQVSGVGVINGLGLTLAITISWQRWRHTFQKIMVWRRRSVVWTRVGLGSFRLPINGVKPSVYLCQLCMRVSCPGLRCRMIQRCGMRCGIGRFSLNLNHTRWPFKLYLLAGTISLSGSILALSNILNGRICSIYWGLCYREWNGTLSRRVVIAFWHVRVRMWRGTCLSHKIEYIYVSLLITCLSSL